MLDIDVSTVTASATVSGIILAVGTAFGKLVWWLSDQFKETKAYLENLLDNHELLDQGRHTDNVARFVKIETKIDTVIDNGNIVHN